MKGEQSLMNAEDFLIGIKNLNEQSSWEEISQFLYYDMKKQAELSKKVNNFKILNQFGISLEYVVYCKIKVQTSAKNLYRVLHYFCA